MGAYASIATWPGRGIRNQFGARLSRTVREGAPMTLSIDERRFNLMARGDRAWAPDRETEAAHVGALRSGRSMSIEGVSGARRAFAAVYALSGGACAIADAALELIRNRGSEYTGANWNPT